MNAKISVMSTFAKCGSENLSMADSMKLLVYVITFSNVSSVKNKLNY